MGGRVSESKGSVVPIERIESRILLVRGRKVLLDADLATHKDLASKLHVLEKKTEALALRHDGFAASTRLHLRQVFDAIRELMRAPEPIKRRPIGFVNSDAKKRS